MNPKNTTNLCPLSTNTDKGILDLPITKLGQEAERLLKWLATYGKDDSGGITRLLYSKPWSDAQQALFVKMQELGLSPRYDEVGNLFGRVDSLDNCTRTVLTGSHIDTVRNGGLYDGSTGIVAGLLALHYLKTHYGPPKLNLEVVSFCEEEGSRFPFTFWGSTNVVRSCETDPLPLNVPDVLDEESISLADAMCKAGFHSNTSPSYPGQLVAFIELHVEQGSYLEQSGLSIGIVEQIVAQRRYTIDVIGVANHAGTTSMKLRRDALYGATQMIETLITNAKRWDDELVATVGKVTVAPNTPNVIPQHVSFSVDVRHRDDNRLDEFCRLSLAEFRSIASRLGLQVTDSLWMDQKAIPMDPSLTNQIEHVSRSYSLGYMRMPSGAGHDAQVMAPHVPTAIIFIPSHAGISHSPNEYTSPTDLDTGIRVLISTLYRLAYL